MATKSYPKRIRITRIYKKMHKMFPGDTPQLVYHIFTGAVYHQAGEKEPWRRMLTVSLGAVRWGLGPSNWSNFKVKYMLNDAKRITFADMPEEVRIAVRNELEKKEPWKHSS
jgi:hypothetical protein